METKSVNFIKKSFTVFVLTLVVFFVLILVKRLKVDAASFTFSPSSRSFLKTCRSSVDVMINASGQSSNAAEAILLYNPNEINIIDSIGSQGGTQIREGVAFQAYFYNQVDSNSGTIRIGGFSTSNFVTSSRVFATIVFESKPGVTSTSFQIQFNGAGNTTDSNIADSNNNSDILSSVGSGSYTFEDGDCTTPDTEPPVIQFINPSSNDTVLAEDSQIVVTISDAASNIDLTQVQFTVNGVIYSPNSTEVAYTGSGKSYTFVITPAELLPRGETVEITISGKDIAGNLASQTLQSQIGELTTPTDNTGGGNNGTLDPTDIIDNTPVVIKSFFSPQSSLNGTALENTIFAPIVERVGVANTVAIGGFLLLLLNILPLLSLLTVPGLAINFLTILLGKKVKKPWGIVMDKLTKKPIGFASCSLYLAGSQYRIDQTLTDMQGRYSLTAGAGEYRLVVKQQGYQTFEGTIIVPESKSSYVYDVELISLDASGNISSGINFQKIRMKIFSVISFFSKYILFFGLLFSAISLGFKISPLNIIIFGLYIVLTITTYYFTVFKRFQPYAVTDSTNNLRIPYAKVTLYDPSNWQVVDARTASFDGLFDFLLSEGKFAMSVSAAGYTFPSVKNTLQVIKQNQQEYAIIDLKMDRKKVNILVDPIGLVQNQFSSATNQAAAPQDTQQNNAASQNDMSQRMKKFGTL